MGAGSAISKLRRMVARRGAAGLVEWTGDFVFWRAYHARLLYRHLRWGAAKRRGGPGGVVADVQGLRLHLNPDDNGLSMELAVEGVHEPILTGLWQELIQPGMTVVDVGANIGYFALLAARRVGQTGRVIAIEPAPATLPYLRRNIHENHAANVAILECAVGRTPGRQPLYLCEKANWNSLIPNDDAVAVTEVSVETLDRLLASEFRVDVVRMDVEGYEGHVIAGMTTVLARHRPSVVLELHAGTSDGPAVRAALDPLFVAGHRLRWCYPRRWEEVLWGRVRTPETLPARAAAVGTGGAPCDTSEMSENYSICLGPQGSEAGKGG